MSSANDRLNEKIAEQAMFMRNVTGLPTFTASGPDLNYQIVCAIYGESQYREIRIMQMTHGLKPGFTIMFVINMGDN